MHAYGCAIAPIGGSARVNVWTPLFWPFENTIKVEVSRPRIVPPPPQKPRIFGKATLGVFVNFNELGVLGVFFWCCSENTTFTVVSGPPFEKKKKMKVHHPHVCPFWRVWVRPSAHGFCRFFCFWAVFFWILYFAYFLVVSSSSSSFFFFFLFLNFLLLPPSSFFFLLPFLRSSFFIVFFLICSLFFLVSSFLSLCPSSCHYSLHISCFFSSSCFSFFFLHYSAYDFL